MAGRESWGTIYAIFVPRDGARDLRQTLLAATSYEQATSELESLDERGLRELLESSEPKSLG